MTNVYNWLFVGVQTLLFIAIAPLLSGWIKRNKCFLQNRSPSSIDQPYRDLLRLFNKRIVIAEQASWIFRATPYIVFGSAVLAASILPFLATSLPTAAIADVIVLVSFFALARFFLALAGMDIGTAFGGMGSSREMTLSSLTEPAILISVFTLAMTASTTNLSTTVNYILEAGIILRPSFIFAALGLMMVAIAETGRIPVDNPSTHLELTMVHEAMILEYSGRHLALIEWASEIKLMLYAVLIVNLFFPWGIATEISAYSLAISTVAIVFKLMILGTLLALSETMLAKLRLFRVPGYLSFAFLVSLVGMLSHVILEVG